MIADIYALGRRFALPCACALAVALCVGPMRVQGQDKPAPKPAASKSAPAAREDRGALSQYGSAEFSESALIGILYDLKQNQKHQKLQIDVTKYNQITNEFVSSNWDEGVLNRYYRVTRPMYTTQVFIPLGPASDGPKAFGVEKIVKPNFWMIHYKGQVAPPTSGRWRFWGYGSEVCCVAVNGKTVLVSNWLEQKPMPMPDVPWKSEAPQGQPMHLGHLIGGSWIELKAGEVIDLDVLIGERGGGNFSAVLLVEKEGETYEMRNGKPVFPIFQLAPYNTPDPRPGQPAPPFARNGPIWKGVQ
ncbi:hypothetical protein DB346_02495 [Verrucomicrobia bacterium LW23]|nr:hypothetical protein DB346_04160 [Verrucomicrobia bacterium LW23]PTY04318.1 hypothetical protein DB346_02495 [Verrucomicrobia bacterium LW23]